MSQLDLAGEAEVSTRHISFIENGRAAPSREMVLLLASALDVPLRERNTLLTAAGFAPVYSETPLSDASMAEVRRALRLILRQQEPFGAVVYDGAWGVAMVNRAFARVLRLAGLTALSPYELLPAPRESGLRHLLLPTGLRPLVRNFDEVYRAVMARVHQELLWSREPARKAQVEALLQEAGLSPAGKAPMGPLPLIIPVELALGPHTLRLLSTIATLGTAQDITLQELRIETFHPADEVSERLARELAAGDEELPFPTLEGPADAAGPGRKG